MATPYYEEDGITIYHGDCRELLWGLSPDWLVLTDPPYGINLQNHDKAVESSRPYGWNVSGDNDQSVGNYVLELLSDYPTIAFASPDKPWEGEWHQRLVWYKGPAVGGGGEPSMYWKFDWELIQVRNLAKLNGGRDTSVIEQWVTPADFPYHPTQKPHSVLSYLIGKVNSSVVFDPFMGSGSTLRAAKDLGRRAVGIEIEERYCEIAAKRLSQKVFQFA